MTKLVELLKKLLRDVTLFARTTGGLKLRGYQEAVARAIVHSVVHHEGLGFVVIFPRQSGKNELQAQLQAYLLTLLSKERGEMVQVSPTWRPQTENAMHRLESVLSANLVVKDRWEKHFGHVYQLGRARLVFLSGSPTSNIVGATASLLLSVDEAQDILIDKYDKEIAPMAASTNATRVFWGTAWSSNTLLAREEKTALAQQESDGVQRVWRLTCDQVAAEVPAYGTFVAQQVAKLGRHHPMVRTQYYSEDIDAAGGLFPPERLAMLQGDFPPQLEPSQGQRYAMTLDVAGEDERGGQGFDSLANPGRDSTALTIARVNTSSEADHGLRMSSYEIIYRRLWTGVRHTDIYNALLKIADMWQVRFLVVDSTGVGAGLTSFLQKSLGDRVIPFVFNSKTKSDLGWAFLSLVDGGRLQTYLSPKGPFDPSGAGAETQGRLAALNQLFFQQLGYCQYEIRPGPEKKLTWSVPDGTRDPATGDLIHDDLVISAAMLALLDQRSFFTTGPAAVVTARDPLDDMRRF